MGGMARMAGEADIDGLVSLMGEFYEESGYAVDAERARASFAFYLGNPQFGAVLVTGHEMDVRGYLVMKYYYAMSAYGFVCSIEDLFVRADSRRQGLADGLLGFGLKLAGGRGIQDFSVDVGRRNAAAQGLYRKYGFEGRNEDIATMELGLPMPLSPGARSL